MTDKSTTVYRSTYFESMMDSMNFSDYMVSSYSKLILSLECLYIYGNNCFTIIVCIPFMNNRLKDDILTLGKFSSGFLF
jgi:hypothetical protein